MEDLIFIGTRHHIVRETERAVLFKIGVSNGGHDIEKFVPKSQMYQRNGNIYVPKWLARKLGMWNYNEDISYYRQGYYKMYEDVDDDLPF